MRELSDTLLAAQKAAPPINPLAKIVLTYGEDSYTYDKSRILDIKETGDGPLQSLTVILLNDDKSLTGIDLQGYEGVLSYGAGKEYSDCPPMKVIAQEFDSIASKLTCTLTLVGICNLMAKDRATGSYMPDEDDDKPVKTLVNQLIGGSLAGFTNCQSYGVIWEEGYDELADNFKPRDSVRVYEGNNRLSKLNQLLGYTKNVALPKADGKVHIFKPKTGTDYDYKYSLQEPEHIFFAKSLRNRLVIPNRILIRSYPDSDPFYEGEAVDTESYDKLPMFESHRMRLESNEQATAIAQAKLAQAKMWSEAGSGAVPMNIAQEVYDRVLIVDSREKDERAGNIGRFTRHYNLTKSSKWGVSATWEMGFAFGDWQNVRKALAGLGITIDDVENYFSRFQAKDAYIENLLAKNMGFVWIDPESNMIDASKLTSEFIDSLPDGEYYYKARNMHLDGETGLTLWEGMKYYIRFSPDSDEAGIRRQDTAPSGVDTGEYWIDTSGAEPIIKRWTGSAWFTIEQAEIDALNKGLLTSHTKLASLSPDGLVLLDEVLIGDDYGLVQKAALTAAGLVVLDQTVDGTYKKTLAADYSGSHIKMSALIEDSSHRSVTSSQKSSWNSKPENMDEIDMGVTWGKPKKDQITAQGYLKLNANTYKDGQWYSENGVIINASTGIEIRGGKLTLKDSGGGHAGQLYIDTSGYLRLDPWIQTKSKTILPVSNKTYYLGLAGSYWKDVYAERFVTEKITLGINQASFKQCNYIDLPTVTSLPSGSEGRMVVDTSASTLYRLRVYLGGAWRFCQLSTV